MIELSIIIPSNEELDPLREYLPEILKRLARPDLAEVILVNANSKKEIGEYLKDFSNLKLVESPLVRRSVQMNLGAKSASGKILFFLHLDSLPVKDYDLEILETVQNGAKAGCFRLKFDMSHWLLNISTWFTRFNSPLFRGGDQGLFISKSLFESTGGFREDHALFEDIDLCKRLIAKRVFTIMTSSIETSARKYRQNGVVRLQASFTLLTLCYWLGMENKKLLMLYKKLVR